MIDAEKKKAREAPSMNCSEFQQQLPELFESGEDLNRDPHLLTCENCSSLVQDLQYIAQQAKMLLPLHDPRPEVWDNIQSALKKDPSGTP